MLKEKKISVIIPIYNVEKYLNKCIESVINQTYESLELILVDDGSTDNCGSICDFYANKDARIKVIHKENGGQSSARNIGLDSATGYYIAFLDSDDWIDPEMYETLIDLLENRNADVAACGFKEVYQNKTVIPSNTGLIKVYDREEVVNSLFSDSMNVRFEVWNKVFKREIIGNTRFVDKQIFEEVYFDRIVFLRLNRLVYLDKPMHNYLKIREGNTNSNFKENKLSIFKEFNDFIWDLKSEGLLDSAKRFEAYALHSVMSLYCSAVMQNTPKSILIKLRRQHLDYHYNIVDSPYFEKGRSLFFLYLPTLYCKISKFKNRNL